MIFALIFGSYSYKKYKKNINKYNYDTQKYLVEGGK